MLSNFVKRTGYILFLVIVSFSLCIFITGCGTTVDYKVYVVADEETYNAVADDYLILVKESSRFTPEQKARRELLISTWNKRILNAKEYFENGK